jgi:hypothetical protein
MTDETVTFECLDCDGNYTLTRSHINWFVGQDLIPPRRCQSCRTIRRSYRTPPERNQPQDTGPDPEMTVAEAREAVTSILGSLNDAVGAVEALARALDDPVRPQRNR